MEIPGGTASLYLRFPSEWQLYTLVTEPTRVRGFLHHLGKKRYSGGSHMHKKCLDLTHSTISPQSPSIIRATWHNPTVRRWKSTFL